MRTGKVQLLRERLADTRSTNAHSLNSHRGPRMRSTLAYGVTVATEGEPEGNAVFKLGPLVRSQ
jgi:hypothetical protein